MPIDPNTIITAAIEGSRLVEQVLRRIREALAAGDVAEIARVSDILRRDVLRSRELLDDAEASVRGAL